jgi:hypothetical protein
VCKRGKKRGKKREFVCLCSLFFLSLSFLSLSLSFSLSSLSFLSVSLGSKVSYDEEKKTVTDRMKA